MLRNYMDRPVLDRSGLAGGYDVDVAFLSDRAVPPRVDAPQSDAPVVFTALQEQLGLKLEATRTPIDVLVIDHIERPTG